MKLELDRYTLRTKVPFAIARSSTSSYERVRVRLTDDGAFEGWGEAAPNVYYKESADTVTAALDRFSRILERSRTIASLHDIDVLEEWLRVESPNDGSARAAVSAAAHDLLGKKEGRPVWKLYDLDPAFMPVSSYTIVLSQREDDLFQRVAEAHPFPLLKIKLGTDHDEWIARTVRTAAPNKTLRADANAAWNPAQAVEMTKVLADLGFELIEQPVAPSDIDVLRQMKFKSPIPMIADESCRTASDIPKLEGAVDGINIKLSKCGGLAEARRMIREAERREMKVMLGCMVESSLGITAMAHLAPLADFADLDGALLVANDPYEGATISSGVIRLPGEPGLGVRLKSS